MERNDFIDLDEGYRPGKAEPAGHPGADRGRKRESEPEIRESKLKDVAALAVAAIQSSRRKRA